MNRPMDRSVIQALIAELQTVTNELRQWLATAETDDAALPVGRAVVEHADALIAKLTGPM